MMKLSTIGSSSGLLYGINKHAQNTKLVPKPVSSTNIHIPLGYCYVIIDYERKLIKLPSLYVGKNVIDNLLRELRKDAYVFERVVTGDKKNTYCCHL